MTIQEQSESTQHGRQPLNYFGPCTHLQAAFCQQDPLSLLRPELPTPYWATQDDPVLFWFSSGVNLFKTNQSYLREYHSLNTSIFKKRGRDSDDFYEMLNPKRLITIFLPVLFCYQIDLIGLKWGPTPNKFLMKNCISCQSHFPNVIATLSEVLL